MSERLWYEKLEKSWDIVTHMQRPNTFLDIVLKHFTAGSEGPGCCSAMGSGTHPLLWRGPFPGLQDKNIKAAEQWKDKNLPRFTRQYQTYQPNYQTLGDNIWGECWRLVRFPPIGKTIFSSITVLVSQQHHKINLCNCFSLLTLLHPMSALVQKKPSEQNKQYAFLKN